MIGVETVADATALIAPPTVATFFVALSTSAKIRPSTAAAKSIAACIPRVSDALSAPIWIRSFFVSEKVDALWWLIVKLSDVSVGAVITRSVRSITFTTLPTIDVRTRFTDSPDVSIDCSRIDATVSFATDATWNTVSYVVSNASLLIELLSAI